MRLCRQSSRFYEMPSKGRPELAYCPREMRNMAYLSERRFPLCGAQVDAMTREELIVLIDRATVSRDRLLILNHNLHSLYLYFTNKDFKSAYQEASYVYIDGMPVIWIGRAAGLPLRTNHRITFLDSFDSVLSEAENRKWRVFYLGSTEAVLDAGLVSLKQKHPRLIIGGRNGYFSKSGTESDEVIVQVNTFRPDIVFVGMGMPTQELWLAKYHEKIDASVILTSGATLDYVTGHAYQPPEWTGNLGLYGVCRMFSEPRRLWRRYLAEPVPLAAHLLPGILRQRFSGRDRRAAENGL